MVNDADRAKLETLTRRAAETLLSGGALRAAIEEAFEAGREAARAEIESQIESVLRSRRNGASVSAQASPTLSPAPGSMREAVRTVLREAPVALTVDEIAARAGLERRAARKTLNKLKELGQAEKDGDRWLWEEVESTGEVPGTPPR